MTKRDEVRDFIRSQADRALCECVADMMDRAQAEVIRANRKYLASYISYAVTDEYSFIELADIMGWKRTRVRR